MLANDVAQGIPNGRPEGFNDSQGPFQVLLCFCNTLLWFSLVNSLDAIGLQDIYFEIAHEKGIAGKGQPINGNGDTKYLHKVLDLYEG